MRWRTVLREGKGSLPGETPRAGGAVSSSGDRTSGADARGAGTLRGASRRR
jgi:hypothetical protein